MSAAAAAAAAALKLNYSTPTGKQGH